MKLFNLLLIAGMLAGTSAHAIQSSCEENANKVTPIVLKDHTKQHKIDGKFYLPDDYFVVTNSQGQHSVQNGDMIYMLALEMSKKFAKKVGLSKNDRFMYGGLLIVRCDSKNPTQVERVWWQADVEEAKPAPKFDNGLFANEPESETTPENYL